MLTAHASQLGWPITAAPADADLLQGRGLHRTDPRFGFALAALQAAPAAKREAVLARFHQHAAPVPLPPGEAFLGLAAAEPSNLRNLEHLAAFCAKCSWALATEIIYRGVFTEGRPGVAASAKAHTITLLLERYGAEAIESLEHGFLAGLSYHPNWRAASREFLEPYADNFLADWLADRPAFAAFARDMRRLFADVPAWMAGPDA